MQIKGILFGFGLGLVFLSAVFLLVNQYEDRQTIEQAARLGMVWPADDTTEVVRRALEMGMVFEEDEEPSDEYDY